MASIGKAFDLALPYLARLPKGQYFDTSRDELRPELAMQTETQTKAAALRQLFPEATLWAKRYQGGDCNWWEYHTTLPNGLCLKIYAVSEAPTTCTVRMKKVTRIEKVPVTFEEHEVEVEVIDGWDCGPDADKED